ncbi:MAG TPA: sugar MFS transporter [Nevskiaceae bacterium]|nr:sugar MFS transporter [Nevskiaceae bacterium]
MADFGNGRQTHVSVQASTSILVGVVGLFFIWGGITSLNDVLIPKLRDLFQLNYAQAMLIQFAFFTAYAVVSLPAGGLISRLGYGRGIVAGLSIMGIGCVLFVPAASLASYALFLGGLFILAGGITILQVAANPLIANIGEPGSGHSRLTLAQAFNSLGTTLMPYIGAQLILGDVAHASPANLSAQQLMDFQAREAAVVGHGYLAIAGICFLVAAAFWFWRRALGQFSDGDSAASFSGSLALLRSRPRLAFGVLGIFLYVGAEVTIGSVLVNYLMLPSTLGLSQRAAGEHLPYYWGGAMVGRFIGAVLLRRIRAGVLLSAVAMGAVCLVLSSAASQGALAAWALLAVGLMNAIMFPTIFSLAVENMGPDTPRASGLLCMAIVGGAVVPLFSGFVADASSLAVALTVPAACYLVIAAFGWSARKPAQA